MKEYICYLLSWYLYLVRGERKYIIWLIDIYIYFIMVQNKARATYEIEKILSVENKYNAVQNRLNKERESRKISLWDW
jgi:hypothetical protein